jgi:glycosyltransferase involved in cell wall biosynthesis
MIRACLFGAYNATHPATRMLRAALGAAGCEIRECHEALWERTRDKMAAYFGLASLARLLVAYAGVARRLAAAWRREPAPDLVVAGFNGQLDVLLARLVAGRRARLLFAPLVTLTETLVDDRRLYRRRGLKARLAAFLDRRTLEAADLVLLDTEAHRAYVAGRLTPKARTATLYLGADPMFVPTPPRRRSADTPLRVLFYGQYVPLHGALVIVEAAALAGHGGGMEFTLIGTGPDRAAAEALAEARGCAHVRFIDWVPYEELPQHLAETDVALGIFGLTSKARMVIPTKVYQAAAAGRAIVTGDTPAIREIFTPGHDALLVPRGDPGALVRALRRLRDDPELGPRLGEAAGRLLSEHLDARAQGARLRSVLAGAFPDLGERLGVPVVTAPAGAGVTI